MEKQDYNYIFTTNVNADKVFDAISHVPEWWAPDFEGSSQKTDDVFKVHFGDVFVSFKITEIVPGKKMVWLVTDCDLTWLKDNKEWNGTKIEWEIKTVNNETQISMTHVGLVPGIECFEDCSNGWNFHIGESLFKLITEGVGVPGVNTRQKVK